MSYDPALIDLLANQVLNCICGALTETAALVENQPGCPCRTCVVAGTPALVICETCDPSEQGQLYVTVESVFRSSNFPVPDRTADFCKGSTIAVQFVATLTRCAAIMDDDGTPPSCDDMAAVASIIHTDMYTVMNAVQCCMTNDPRRGRTRRVAFLEQRAKGPDGTTVGFDTRFIVDLHDSCGCPPEIS